MKMEGIIYKAENLENGFIYIGATTKNMQNRMEDHTRKAKKDNRSYFQEAIATFGHEAFSWQQIDSATNIDELANKEKYYIELFNSKEQGYNKDSGGGFRKTIYQHTTEGLLIGEWPSLSWAAFSVLGRKKSVSSACLGSNKSYKGFNWTYSQVHDFNLDLRKKKVIQFDLNGEQIAIFDSAAEASRQTGVSKTCITRCCRGERKQSSGFVWKYYVE